MWALYPLDPPIRAGLIRAGSRVVSSYSLRRRTLTMHLCFYIRHISATARVLTSRVESTGKAFTAITAQPLTFSVTSQTPQAALQSLLTAGSFVVSVCTLRFKLCIHLLGQSCADTERIKNSVAHNSKRLEPY